VQRHRHQSTPPGRAQHDVLWQHGPQRTNAKGEGRGGTGGPVGADGARPMLSWAARLVGPPRQPAHGAGGAATTTSTTTTTTPARPTPPSSSNTAQTATPPITAQRPAQPHTATATPEEHDEWEGMEGTAGEGDDQHDAYDDRRTTNLADDRRPPQPTDQPQHRVLWRQWQQEQRELQNLQRQGYPEQHWIMQIARRRVEAAEAAWRDAKPTTTLWRKLQRAEGALRRMEARADKVAAQIAQLDEDYQRNRKSLADRLTDAQAKAQSCKDNLDQLKAEAGGEASGTSGRERSALRAAADELGDNVGPQLQLASEMLQSGDAAQAKQHVDAVLSTLFRMHGTMRETADGAGDPPAACYRLDGDDRLRDGFDGDDWSEDDDLYGDQGMGGTSSAAAAAAAAAQLASAARGQDRGGDYSGRDNRPPKKPKTTDEGQADMDEQQWDQMQVPAHMAQADAAVGQPARNVPASNYAPHEVALLG
jgi:hypothetical protein